MSSSVLVRGLKEIFTASDENLVLRGDPPYSILVSDGKFVFVGKEKEISAKYDTIIDAEGLIAWPGMVDSHTHLVYAYDREDEFFLKVEGSTYEEIAQKGGGILNSAKRNSTASLEDTYLQTKKRLLQIISYGITTVEIKSGYALTTEGELNLLRAVKKLKEEFPVEIVPTFLGAHAYPERFKYDHEGYLSLLIEEMLPAVKEESLAEFVDIFIEEGYFSVKEAERFLTAAKEMGFKIKVHADEFNALGGTELAAELGAVSVDHLEKVTDSALEKMRENDVVGTVLPITSLFSNLPYAPAKRIVDSGVTLAVATDFNPGSAMSGFLPLAASLVAIKTHVPIDQTLRSITINGAKALKREANKGSIEVGKDADFLLLDAPTYSYPVYQLSHNFVKGVFVKGREILKNESSPV